MTILELATLTNAQFTPGAQEASAVVSGVSSLEDARSGDVTFFANPKYLAAVRSTQATAVLVPNDFPEENLPAILLRVENPSVAFTLAAQHLIPPAVAYPAGVHPTAVLGENVEVDPTASIQPFVVLEADVKVGAGTVVGAHCFIGRGARLGSGCRIHPQAFIAERTVIGDRVIIHSGAVIGSDGFGFNLVDGRHVKIPQIGHVQIDDDVEIGAGTTIDRARFGRTWIQVGAKIDNLVQIAHNVVIGPHCLIISQTGISGSARLGSHVTLAGQVGVVGHVTVGDRVVVAAKSGISKDVAADVTLFGMIGIPIAEGRKILAHYHRLPATAVRLKMLEAEVAELRGALKGQGE